MEPFLVKPPQIHNHKNVGSDPQLTTESKLVLLTCLKISQSVENVDRWWSSF